VDPWSWALGAGAVTSAWLVGSGRRVGWAVALVLQCGWLTYGVASGQLGFAASALVFGAVNVRNLRRWRHGPPTTTRPRPVPPRPEELP
jgi:hypothetical protein